MGEGLNSSTAQQMVTKFHIEFYKGGKKGKKERKPVNFIAHLYYTG